MGNAEPLELPRPWKRTLYGERGQGHAIGACAGDSKTAQGYPSQSYVQNGYPSQSAAYEQQQHQQPYGQQGGYPPQGYQQYPPQGYQPHGYPQQLPYGAPPLPSAPLSRVNTRLVLLCGHFFGKEGGGGLQAAVFLCEDCTILFSFKYTDFVRKLVLA